MEVLFMSPSYFKLFDWCRENKKAPLSNKHFLIKLTDVTVTNNKIVPDFDLVKPYMIIV